MTPSHAMKRTFAVLFPILVLAALGWAAGRGRQHGSPVHTHDSWVAFSADYHVVLENGVTATGKFYQNSDGSSRDEEEGISYVGIVIKNIEQNRFYEFHKGAMAPGEPEGFWTSQPMRLPPHGWLAPRFGSDRPNVKQLPDPIEKLEVFQEDQPDGSVLIRAPALNYFPIRQQLAIGTAKTYFNIKVGPQPAEVFTLPPGAKVRELSEPGGIVWVDQAPSR